MSGLKCNFTPINLLRISKLQNFWVMTDCLKPLKNFTFAASERVRFSSLGSSANFVPAALYCGQRGTGEAGFLKHAPYRRPEPHPAAKTGESSNF